MCKSAVQWSNANMDWREEKIEEENIFIAGKYINIDMEYWFDEWEKRVCSARQVKIVFDWKPYHTHARTSARTHILFVALSRVQWTLGNKNCVCGHAMKSIAFEAIAKSVDSFSFHFAKQKSTHTCAKHRERNRDRERERYFLLAKI